MITVSAGCASAGTAVDEPKPTPSSSPTSTSPADIALDQIIRPSSSPPRGTRFQFAVGNDGILQPVQDSPADVQAAIREGWINTAGNWFFSPGLWRALDADEVEAYATDRRMSEPGHYSVGSWVSAYEDSGSASRALDVIVSELQERWQLHREAEPGLGEEGWRFQGNPPQAHHLPTTIFFWRIGEFLLEVVAHGSVEPDAAEIRAVADEMQAKFESLGA